ncbi:hypothetical protein Acf1_00023 [Acidovorax phage ACF1]|nr:hypothetical protein Acf1_00023 [Acidovorax phage ACF1]
MAKLANWFVNGEVPRGPGVYNVSCRKSEQSGDWYARWDGERWFVADRLRAVAAAEQRPTTPGNYWHQTGSWRGLAENPA